MQTTTATRDLIFVKYKSGVVRRPLSTSSPCTSTASLPRQPFGLSTPATATNHARRRTGRVETAADEMETVVADSRVATKQTQNSREVTAAFIGHASNGSTGAQVSRDRFRIPASPPLSTLGRLLCVFHAIFTSGTSFFSKHVSVLGT